MGAIGGGWGVVWTYLRTYCHWGSLFVCLSHMWRSECVVYLSPMEKNDPSPSSITEQVTNLILQAAEREKGKREKKDMWPQFLIIFSRSFCPPSIGPGPLSLPTPSATKFRLPQKIKRSHLKTFFSGFTPGFINFPFSIFGAAQKWGKGRVNGASFTSGSFPVQIRASAARIMVDGTHATMQRGAGVESSLGPPAWTGGGGRK